MPTSVPPRLPLQLTELSEASRIFGGIPGSHKGENAQTHKERRGVVWRGTGWANSHHDNGLILSTRGSTGLQSKWRNAPASLLNTLFTKLWLLL